MVLPGSCRVWSKYVIGTLRLREQREHIVSLPRVTFLLVSHREYTVGRKTQLAFVLRRAGKWHDITLEKRFAPGHCPGVFVGLRASHGEKR